MIEIEKYARAAASTARTPPNSPARHAAIEAENAARVTAEQFVKGLEAERDELRARLDALERQEPVAQVEVSVPHLRSIVVRSIPGAEIPAAGLQLYARPVPAQAVPDVPNAACDVLAERRRQVEKEGYEPAHDDEHADGSLAMAAACYADKERPQSMCPGRWPWSADSWKPKDRRTDLVRAAALLLAEIERMDRAAALEAAR